MFYNIRELIFTYFYCSAGSSCLSNIDFEIDSCDHYFNFVDPNIGANYFKN